MDKEEKDITKDPSNISIFSNNTYNVFLYQKSQKLLTALYLITDFLPAEEPLKWAIRSKALGLFSATLSLSGGMSLERKKILNSVVTLSLEILSICEVAMHSSLMSPMNFELLKKEFEYMIRLVETNEKDSLKKQAILSEEFLSTPDPYKGMSYIGHSDKGHDTVLNKMTFNPSKNNKSVTTPNYPRKTTLSDNSKDKSLDKNARQEVIIETVKKRGQVTIKDLTTVILDCSEKTIQRELLSLVAKGVLNKVGERRWSKYSIAQL